MPKSQIGAVLLQLQFPMSASINSFGNTYDNRDGTVCRTDTFENTYCNCDGPLSQHAGHRFGAVKVLALVGRPFLLRQ